MPVIFYPSMQLYEKDPNCPKKTDLLTLTKAARKYKCTRQCIFKVLKSRRLVGYKIDKYIFIGEKDLARYFKTKYNRDHTAFEENIPIFDNSKGRYSVVQTAKLLRKPIQHIYFLIRQGELKTQKFGGRIIVYRKEIIPLMEKNSCPLDVFKAV